MLENRQKKIADVCIVIPVKNGYPEIKACIEGWLQQSVLPKKILVIDSGSTDNTLAYLSQIPEVEILSIAPEQFNHGATRNLGVVHATTNLLLFTVQDARPVNTQVLATMLNVLENNPKVDAVCGQQIVPHEPDKNPVDWFRPVDEPTLNIVTLSDHSQFNQLSPEEKKQQTAWDNVIALYRKTALLKWPFEAAVFGEDLIWAKTCLLGGGTIAFQHAARVYHYHHETPDFVFRRTLTTLYLRYRHLGYFPQPSSLTIHRILVWFKLIAKAGFNSMLNAPMWLRYNWLRFRAVNRARVMFKQYLSLGETELDKLHEYWCAHPPTPTKK
jgi:rhamnosyltransferase